MSDEYSKKNNNKYIYTLLNKIFDLYKGRYIICKKLYPILKISYERLMNIIIKDIPVFPIQYLLYSDLIQKYLSYDDFLNLQLVSKQLQKPILDNNEIFFYYFSNRKEIIINKPQMKTRNNKIDLYNNDLKIVIDIINNNYIYCKKRFTICNKFANSLNVLIKYIYYIDVNIIKTINNYIDIIVKQDFVATPKLKQVIDAFKSSIRLIQL